jgi:hypothetical protein
MFITFETDTNKQITVDITSVQSWDKESLVRYSADQLGVGYVDFKISRKNKKQLTTIDFQPLKRQYRQEMLVMKRPIRKYAVKL